MLHLIVHVVSIVNFAYAIYWERNILDDPLSKPGSPRAFGGRWKYLTSLNLWIQLIYFIISFLNSIFGSHSTDEKSSTTLQKIRDFLFSTIAFPIGQFVGIIFWGLYHIDRELIFPVARDKVFPNHINHMLHTTVIPVQLLELVLLYHLFPRKKLGLATISVFIALYLTWTLIVAHFGGFWVYPIFRVLGTVQRIIFMIFCSMFGGLLYLLSESLNNFVWSQYRTWGRQTENVGDIEQKTRGQKPQKID